MAALPFSMVTDEDQLNQDMVAIAGGTGDYTITFGSGFTLNTDLLAVNLGVGGSLTLQGAGQTINGANEWRGFLVYAGIVTIDNLAIDNTAAIGGTGGAGGSAGGGGAGLGGGLFVASAGAVTLNAVTFSSDSAIGGGGGAAIAGAGGDGGGGLGGNGGNSDGAAAQGGGGGVGQSASGGADGLAAGEGIIPGAAPGGFGSPGSAPGGANGGGGGFGTNNGGTGGVNGKSIAGGFGGGGSSGNGTFSGRGGFGGGGGGQDTRDGGPGGFGGGGGGGGRFSTNGGPGGFGGGPGGSAGGGGGGFGGGGDIFVQQGGRLTIGTGSLGKGMVAGGTGANGGGSGLAFGSSIFIQGNQSITFATVAGETTTVSGVIADEHGSNAPAPQMGSLVVGGGGTLKLAVADTYSGGTAIDAGARLELVVPTAAGGGDIVFAGAGTLQVDTQVAPTNVIGLLGATTGATIDLKSLAYVTGATATISGGKLTVTSGARTETLNVAPSVATATVAKDTSGTGTAVTLSPLVVTNEAQLNQAFSLLAGSTAATTITIGASFTLNTALNAINLGAGGSLTIDGGEFALNGAHAQRGLLVYSGNVTIDDLALNNMAAIGGAGGSAPNPGGGGAGLGGGLLVASGGNVTLDNVTFSGDSATGGAGGSYVNNGFGGGGGGGLGGAGGAAPNNKTDGGGGGVGTGAAGGTNGVNSGQGAAGSAVGAAPGGNGAQSTIGGITGGGGGGGGSSPNGVGFGTNGGGSGGFGGGAGGGANSSHTGGFGGGGAGAGGNPGVAGWGGGAGGGSNYGGGGGGAGLGGDILVQQGGSLTIRAGDLADGAVAGGAAGTGRSGNPGKAGSAYGDGLFLQGNQIITLAPGAGQRLEIRGVIADQNGSVAGSGGQAGLVVNGAGLVDLAAVNTWTGGTTLSSGTLELFKTGSAGSGAITFGAPGGAQVLRLDYVTAATTVSQAIKSLTGGSTSFIYLPNIFSSGIVFGRYVGGNLTFTAAGAAYEFSSLGVGTGYTINASGVVADASGLGVDIFATVLCFAAGTRLRTSHGEVAVEALAEGDLIATHAGERPVTWVGRRHIDIAAHPDPETVQPIRIRRDAVAPGVPVRDLLVSPDHAIHLDGVLIPARLLVNGASIVVETGAPSVTYFHVELAEHAILFAEELEAESYLDTGNRAMFENACAVMLHPDFSVLARIRHRAAATCVPLAVEEAVVRPVWERLAARAGRLAAPLPTTGDPAVRLLAGGRELRPMTTARGTLMFALPPGQHAVRLLSRAARPCDAQPWLDDRRRLGVAVGAILVRHGAEVTEIAPDHPGLADGWWGAEGDDSRVWRWTAGDAAIALPDRASTLEIQVVGTMEYAVQGNHPSAATSRFVDAENRRAA